ncbi:hypothetical protein BGX28_004534, partial [Mortierella sp. GBA30]
SAKSLSEHILASRKPNHQINVRILTSPFQRTRQTAAIIYEELRHATELYITLSAHDTSTAGAIRLEQSEGPIEVEDLRERFFGEFEMKTPSDDLYGAVWREDARNPFHEQFGVESVAAVTKRMTDVVRTEESAAPHGSERNSATEATAETWVVLVSHGDSLQILQTAMRGWSGDRHRLLEHLETAAWRNVAWCEELAYAHSHLRNVEHTM